VVSPAQVLAPHTAALVHTQLAGSPSGSPGGGGGGGGAASAAALPLPRKGLAGMHAPCLLLMLSDTHPDLALLSRTPRPGQGGAAAGQEEGAAAPRGCQKERQQQQQQQRRPRASSAAGSTFSGEGAGPAGGGGKGGSSSGAEPGGSTAGEQPPSRLDLRAPRRLCADLSAWGPLFAPPPRSAASGAAAARVWWALVPLAGGADGGSRLARLSLGTVSVCRSAPGPGATLAQPACKGAAKRGRAEAEAESQAQAGASPAADARPAKRAKMRAGATRAAECSGSGAGGGAEQGHVGPQRQQEEEEERQQQLLLELEPASSTGAAPGGTCGPTHSRLALWVGMALRPPAGGQAAEASEAVAAAAAQGPEPLTFRFLFNGGLKRPDFDALAAKQDTRARGGGAGPPAQQHAGLPPLPPPQQQQQPDSGAAAAGAGARVRELLERAWSPRRRRRWAGGGGSGGDGEGPLAFGMEQEPAAGRPPAQAPPPPGAPRRSGPREALRVETPGACPVCDLVAAGAAAMARHFEASHDLLPARLLPPPAPGGAPLLEVGVAPGAHTAAGELKLPTPGALELAGPLGKVQRGARGCAMGCLAVCSAACRLALSCSGL
jgi:hypothetical protein